MILLANSPAKLTKSSNKSTILEGLRPHSSAGELASSIINRDAIHIGGNFGHRGHTASPLEFADLSAEGVLEFQTPSHDGPTADRQRVPVSLGGVLRFEPATEQ